MYHKRVPYVGRGGHAGGRDQAMGIRRTQMSPNVHRSITNSSQVAGGAERPDKFESLFGTHFNN